MSETKKCYIRRKNLPWVQGKPHHQAALQIYMSSYMDNVEAGAKPEEALISTAHIQGGQFVARFNNVEGELFQYVDEYDNIVHIMMAEPNYVASINRITT